MSLQPPRLRPDVNADFAASGSTFDVPLLLSTLGTSLLRHFFLYFVVEMW
jgi:hypothetical protein